MSVNRDPHHISGHLHVTGRSRFIGDDKKPIDMLIAKSVPSEHPHAKILKIVTEKALALPGVHAVLTARDIPGKNNLGHGVDVEPLLAEDEVVYVGQPVALVVACDEKTAKAAVKLVQVDYQPLTPVLSFEEAIKNENFFIPLRKIERGDIAAAFKKADFVLEGEHETDAQEHLYFETQRCWAIPEEDNHMTLYSATQGTAAVQVAVAHMLGWNNHAVTVDVKRLGGGFGGKEEAPVLWSGLAALACYHTKHPIEFQLSRTQDQSWTSKRHPFKGRYKIGFNQAGKIIAFDIALYSNGGALLDLSIPVLERAMLFAENSYYIPNIRITGAACRTNLPPNTAFRGFGSPQSIFMIESAIHKMARHLKMDVMKIREINLYESGQTTPYEEPLFDVCNREIFKALRKQSQYEKLRRETGEFNLENSHKRRGIGIVPIKFGLSFTQGFFNQGSALLWVYTDGSVSVTHAGVEMGQEVNTKVAQVAANTLGISISKVRIESANTKRVGNASPTAASTAADINCSAAWVAASKVKERLVPVAVKELKKLGDQSADIDHIEFKENKVFDSRKPEVTLEFSEVVMHAYHQQVSLGEHGHYRTPGIQFDRETGRGTPFAYFVQGACVCQVEVDLLSGRHQLLKVYILHESGRTLNESIDKGQITGAFFQGYGWCTMEELKHNEKGLYVHNTLSLYKIPCIRDLPEVFDVALYEHDCEKASLFGSKGVGEPPLLYGEAAYFAIKDAIESIKNYQTDIPLDNPAVPSAVLRAISDSR